MILIAISTFIGFATFTLIVTANRRQIRRLKRRLDTQAETMIVLAELIRDGDEPEDPAASPPSAPARHLHIVRDTAAIAVLALLLRRTGHAAREHPTLTAMTVAAVGVAVAAAVLALPGTPRQPGVALPTTTSLSSYTTPLSSPPPGPTLPSATGPGTPTQDTTTPRPSGVPPLPATPPSTPPSSSGTGTPQPSPTAVSTSGSSGSPGPSTTTVHPTRTPSTPATTPLPPPCLVGLNVDNLIELRLLCP